VNMTDKTKSSANCLYESLKVNSTLTKLNLSKNEIGVDGAESIAESLKVNSALNSLDLHDNKIGDQGAKFIADSLKINTTLTCLNLKGNQIGVEGANGVSEAIKVNASLTNLTLAGNQLGDGVNNIFESLKQNTTLTCVNLESNSIGQSVAKSLQELLAINSTLMRLTIQDNDIGEEGLKGISESLKTNTSLTLLNIGNFRQQSAIDLSNDILAKVKKNQAVVDGIKDALTNGTPLKEEWVLHFTKKLNILHISVENGHYVNTEFILKHNSTIINDKDSTTGNTALHIACQKNNTLLIRLLLSYNAQQKKNFQNKYPFDLITIPNVRSLVVLEILLYDTH